MNTKQTPWERARNLRYKRPALASLRYEHLTYELWEIRDACGEIHWFDDSDGDNLLAAMDGDEEAVFEFRVAFAQLEAKTDMLFDRLCEDYSGRSEYFDDCVVALIGNRYQLVGFDAVEEDYFALTSYESELAETEAGKRVTRWTKKEMLSRIGECMGIVMAFLDLRQQYDYLKATMDVIRNENVSVLAVIREIEEAYERATADEWASDREFRQLAETLPERIWIE